MARIKNMGTATMRFGEGVIVTGSAGDDTHSLVVTGTMAVIGDAYVDNIVLGFGDGDGKTITSGDDDLYIRFVNNTTAQFFAGKNVLELKESASHHNVTINETGQADVDFRVETNNLTHALFCDSGNEIITMMSDSEKTLGTDTNLFVSGTTNSHGTGNRGTAVFSGDVVVSGSFYAKQRQAFTHKYSKSDNTNEALIRFNAAGSNETAGNHTNNRFVAPSDGKLISVILRSTDTMGSTVMRLLTNTDGNANLETGSALDSVTVDVSSANTAFLFVFSDAASYNAGDILGISVNPTSAHGNVDLTSVWEFDWVG